VLRPGEVAFRGIDRDADDFGVERGELRLVVPEPGEFALSAAGEGLDEEGHDDEIALRESVGQSERPAMLVTQDDVGRRLVDRDRLVAVRRERGRRQEGEQDEDERLQRSTTS